MAIVLLSALAFNFVKYEQNKTRYCIVSPNYWGLKVADFSTDGSNSIYFCIKSNKCGATIGNTEKDFYTWHIGE